jgi:hypothetical protein
MIAIEQLERRQLFATNLLLNGDFESPAIGVGASGQAFTTFPTGSTIGSGWKVTAGSVDVVSNSFPATFATKPASGKQCIDMDGLAPGTLSQNVATVSGHRYLLKFSYTPTPFAGGGSPDTRQLAVQFGGTTIVTLSKSVVGSNPASPPWTTVTYLVTAKSSASAVTFVAKSAGTLGMAIDAVSLTAVPFGTASISGQVFADGNGDGIKGVDAIGLSGWKVYIDLNNNGSFDTGDIVSTTDHLGKFSFTGLAAGTYKVKIVQQTGWKLTTSATLSITVSTTAVSGKLFGEQPM